MSPFDSALAATANSLLRHVVPLFEIPPGKRPALVGTGLLVSAHGALYLVSANHVVEQAKPPGRLYYYVDTGVLHRVVGQVRHTSSIGLQRDDLDVAVVRLPSVESSQPRRLDKAPVPLETLLPSLPRSEKEYLVTGFPKSRSRANPHNKQLVSESSGYRLVSADEAGYAKLGVTAASHIVLPLNIEAMRFPGDLVARVADPHGMSGSPLWLLFDHQGSNAQTYTPVVGTIIEYYKSSKLLVATDIGVAIRLINELNALHPIERDRGQPSSLP